MMRVPIFRGNLIAHTHTCMRRLTPIGNPENSCRIMLLKSYRPNLIEYFEKKDFQYLIIFELVLIY